MRLIWILAFVTVTLGLRVDPEDYLVKYGYLASKHTFHDMKEAISDFQKFAHLPITGFLDHATVAMMEMPRCGVRDILPLDGHNDIRKKRFVASSSYWQNRTVTYAFENYNSDLGRKATRRIIALAFKTWSDVTNLVFKEVTGKKGTINIRFGPGGHGCYYPFDGRGGVLAHAFFPDNGQVHFDEDETFTDGTKQGTNLFWVAAHEFGHALGLPHSDVYEALMYPFYKGFKSDFSLPIDDTGAIQALYGCKRGHVARLSIPADGAPFKGILMENWLNLKGEAIHHIEPSVCKYPHQSDKLSLLQSFEAPENNGENIATRIRGYYQAKVSGYHEFALCADHSAKLYVSPSASPADKQQLVKVDKPTGKEFSRCKAAYASSFTAGKLYYVEAIHKDSSGDDYIKVGVRPPNQAMNLITAADMRWALTDTEIRSIICKGRYETLICPQSHQIEVIKAAYGYFRNNANFVNQVKNLCNLRRASSGNCAAASSMKAVTSSCTGKQQCTLYAHDSVFSDKCSRWVYSVLDVTYKCIYKGPQTSPPVTDEPPITQAPTTQLPDTTQSPDTQPPDTTQSPDTQPPTAKPCNDRSPTKSCQSWKRGGHCSSKHIREYWCPMTCGHCGSGPQTSPPVTQTPTTQLPKTTYSPDTQAPTAKPCTDRSLTKDCLSWKSYGQCSLKHVREYWCPMTCGHCV